MIVIKIILIVLQFSFFVMCIENEGKELRFWTVLNKINTRRTS